MMLSVADLIEIRNTVTQRVIQFFRRTISQWHSCAKPSPVRIKKYNRLTFSIAHDENIRGTTNMPAKMTDIAEQVASDPPQHPPENTPSNRPRPTERKYSDEYIYI